MSRHGRHSKDRYRIQAFYTASQKALFFVIGEIEGISMTDAIQRAMVEKAKRLGVVDEDGNFTDKYKDRIKSKTEAIEQAEMYSAK